jgi:nucleoside-diphosphate-sugar epimerase
VLGTLNMLEASRSADVERVIQTSTSETYGTARYTPIEERHPLQSQSPYSASKIAADKLAESYMRSFGLPVTTLRPFNTFGPRQSLRAVIPTIIAQALAGGEIHIGALEPVRDFTYVDDTARAFIAAATAEDTVGATLNVGSGKGIAIGALTELILDVVGSDASVVADRRRLRPESSEVHQLICDATRLREATGWAPTVNLREGLERTVAWMREKLPSTKPELYTV